ncbi:MAG: hypothetical protein ACMV1B_10345, partial [Prevotella sp.]
MIHNDKQIIDLRTLGIAILFLIITQNTKILSLERSHFDKKGYQNIQNCIFQASFINLHPKSFYLSGTKPPACNNA